MIIRSDLGEDSIASATNTPLIMRTKSKKERGGREKVTLLDFKYLMMVSSRGILKWRKWRKQQHERREREEKEEHVKSIG